MHSVSTSTSPASNTRAQKQTNHISLTHTHARTLGYSASRCFAAAAHGVSLNMYLRVRGAHQTTNNKSTPMRIIQAAAGSRGLEHEREALVEVLGLRARGLGEQPETPPRKDK